jgi:hypothetical protein
MCLKYGRDSGVFGVAQIVMSGWLRVHSVPNNSFLAYSTLCALFPKIGVMTTSIVILVRDDILHAPSIGERHRKGDQSSGRFRHHCQEFESPG